MKRTSIIYLMLLTGFFSHSLLAQTKIFQPLTTKEDAAFFKTSRNYFKSVRLHKIDVEAIRQGLISAPLNGRLNASAVSLEIPMPDGTSEVFDMTETPLLAPAIAKLYPDIKTYTGISRTNKNMNISLSLTSSGLNALILNTDKGPVYIEKVSGATRTDRYRSYYTKDAIVPWSKNIQRIKCSATEEKAAQLFSPKAPAIPAKSNRTMANIGIGNNAVGNQFRTFRLAVAITGEFTKKHGNSKIQAFNDVVAYINRVNAVYKNEMSVNFTIVSGQDIVYDDPIKDPYTGTDTGKMLEENQPELTTKVGAANYDLGMVVTATFPSEGNTSSGGGIATAGSLGVDDSKAQNAVQEGDWETGGNSFSQTYTDQVFAHEIGHQFGMPHTFNSNLGSCAGNGSATGNVEIGAGTTIMSYGYTCSSKVANDDYGPSGLPNGPILNFHSASFAVATEYLKTIPNVGTTTPTSNTAPEVSVPATSYTIPKSTPFTLTGSATDVNGDALTYAWEGIDIGTTATPDGTVFTDDTKPPFFRSYAPSASGNTRTYPILSAILDGTNKTKGEKLPSVSFATTHRLTARDNNAVTGGVASKDVSVVIDGNTGPFLVTNDWTGNAIANTNKTVEWSVNNTNIATPNVRILLSTDGGLTFPTELASSVPNTGSASVTVPDMVTTTARIKVEAVGNIFFDISNQNFEITRSLPVTLISFEGREVEKTANLNWQTSSEANASHFEIERSMDARTFKNIGIVKASGTSLTAQKYAFKDTEFATFAARAYYRLRMVDQDGTYAYSRLVSLGSSEILALQAYPNPVKGSVTLSINKADIGSQATLSTASGVALRRLNLTNESFTIDMSSYSPGLYIFHTTKGSVVKIIKE